MQLAQNGLLRCPNTPKISPSHNDSTSSRSVTECITNLNQVFLVTELALVLLTGTTCIGEEPLFPSDWIERMQASFTPISLAPTPTPTVLPTLTPAQESQLASSASDHYDNGADVMGGAGAYHGRLLVL